MADRVKKYDVSYQANFNILGRDTTIYIRTGLLEPDGTNVKWIHDHIATEVHIAKVGTRAFTIGNTEYKLKPGDLFVIPAKTPHFRSYDSFDTDVRGFLTTTPVEKVIHTHLDDYVCDRFFESIDEYLETGNLFSMSLVLPMIFSKFTPNPPIVAEEMNNIEFQIDDFIHRNFRADTTLEDLAEYLHLSPKQANRYVQMYRGTSFKQALNEYRVMITDNMLASKRATLTEISDHILGYQSYSGFWKMYSKIKAKSHHN